MVVEKRLRKDKWYTWKDNKEHLIFEAYYDKAAWILFFYDMCYFSLNTCGKCNEDIQDTEYFTSGVKLINYLNKYYEAE